LLDIRNSWSYLCTVRKFFRHRSSKRVRTTICKSSSILRLHLQKVLRNPSWQAIHPLITPNEVLQQVSPMPQMPEVTSKHRYASPGAGDWRQGVTVSVVSACVLSFKTKITLTIQQIL
jgi:hypothetical protein